ncbi:enoyl-CoA hydratase-related protein [Bradyrhizobium sp. AZCC 1721]|uniref:enoyl-CoA hydratase-related protein n=1 Tax=Bradyrhizobium sp. AZCC 1721 TaxID=3117016 RepID=UPI002FEFED72
MTDLATYSRSGPFGTVVIDDGKANVMSLAMLNALHVAFDQAEKDKTVVILKARGKHFSGGFDLNVFAKGSAQDQYLMVKAGAELALRILSFPTPVVAACQGNAYPMGAFLIMSSDHRIAAGRLPDRHERGRDRAHRAAFCNRNRTAAADASLFQQGSDDRGDVRPHGGRHRRLL